MKEGSHHQPELLEMIPGDSEELTHEEVYEKYSRPQKQTLEKLKEVYPTLKIEKAKLTVTLPDRVTVGKRKITFSPEGLKMKEESYTRETPSGEPDYFYTSRKTTYEYDEADYLIRKTDMVFARLGHIYNFTYTVLPDGQRVLQSILGRQIRRQGVMEPGPQIGDGARIDFDDLHNAAQGLKTKD